MDIDRVSVESYIEVYCAKCNMRMEVYNVETQVGNLDIQVMPCGCKEEEDDD